MMLQWAYAAIFSAAYNIKEKTVDLGYRKGDLKKVVKRNRSLKVM
jgi:hypothetical protein